MSASFGLLRASATSLPENSLLLEGHRMHPLAIGRSVFVAQKQDAIIMHRVNCKQASRKPLGATMWFPTTKEPLALTVTVIGFA